MFGKHPRLNPLESRKRLLLAESELNRAQLVREWQVMRTEVQALTDQAKTVRCMATAVATLVAGLSSRRPKTPTADDKKPAWWPAILKGAGVVSSFWTEFRAARRA
jgi:hypothetical protein